MKSFFSLLCMITTLALVGNPTHESPPNDTHQSIEDTSTGVSFPKEVSFEENGKQVTLEATGVATRQKLFTKIYSVVHYLQDPSSKSQTALFEEILHNDSKAKQLTLHWVRAVNTKSIKEAYEEAIHKTMSEEERNNMSAEIATFLGFFKQDANVGDIYTFRWTPKGLLSFEINGNKIGKIDNIVFAKAIWSIWLGKQSVVNRAKLVANFSKN